MLVGGGCICLVIITSFSKNNLRTTRLETPFLKHCRSLIACRPVRDMSLPVIKFISHKEDKTIQEEMKWIPGGTYQMGSDDFADSKPVHAITVDGFWMDEHEVTNAQFEKFIKVTGYTTVAERPLNPQDYPGVPVEKLVPGSAVFTPPTHKVSLDDPLQWWTYVNGANWRHPYGGQSSVVAKDNEPVVQVCYEDAAAYARWAGKRLPTEAEWEFAARGGKKASVYYWGSELKPGGKWAANIFQGSFPDHNALEDGYNAVAPVKSFSANAYGLYDMEGNVWEWCSDLYRPDYYKNSPQKNPQGPNDSFDPDEPGVIKHVQRGGSFLCSDDYCIRYKAGSRGKGETSSASNNLGFRCVRDK
jgi:formylglycine-generating enzyme required for sulfatase activity